MVVAWTLLGALLAAGGCGGGHPDFFSHCGNGVIDTPYEECDDGAQNDDHGSCLTTCLKARCGDGFLWTDVEQCDGFELGGKTCRLLGFASGTLTCGAGCMFDTSQCVAQSTGTMTERQESDVP
jgi:hypothetical protein